MKTEIIKGTNPNLYVVKGVRCAYPALTQPSSVESGTRNGVSIPHYFIELLLPKEDSIYENIVKLYTAAAVSTFGEKATWTHYIMDGDDQRTADGKASPTPKAHRFGHWKLKLTSERAPALINAAGKLVSDPGEREEVGAAIYGGCFVNAWVSLNAFAVPKYNKRMVKFNLVAVQKAGEGDALGGAPVYNLESELHHADAIKPADISELGLTNAIKPIDITDLGL